MPDYVPGPWVMGPLSVPSPSRLLFALFLPCFTLPLLLTAGCHKPEDRPTAHCHCNANYFPRLSRKAAEREGHRYFLPLSFIAGLPSLAALEQAEPFPPPKGILILS